MSKYIIGQEYYFDTFKQDYGVFVGEEQEDGETYYKFKPIVNSKYGLFNGNVEFSDAVNLPIKTNELPDT